MKEGPLALGGPTEDGLRPEPQQRLRKPMRVTGAAFIPSSELGADKRSDAPPAWSCRCRWTCSTEVLWCRLTCPSCGGRSAAPHVCPAHWSHGATHGGRWLGLGVVRQVVGGGEGVRRGRVCHGARRAAAGGAGAPRHPPPRRCLPSPSFTPPTCRGPQPALRAAVTPAGSAAAASGCWRRHARWGGQRRNCWPHAEPLRCHAAAVGAEHQLRGRGGGGSRGPHVAVCHAAGRGGGDGSGCLRPPMASRP